MIVDNGFRIFQQLLIVMWSEFLRIRIPLTQVVWLFFGEQVIVAPQN